MGDQPIVIARIAHYLAARPGAQGEWPAHLDDAASLLALIQQADPAMIEAGDAAVWIAMVDAALRDRWTLREALESPAPQPPLTSTRGHDEEGEAPVAPEDMQHDDAAWAGISEKEKSA